MPVDRAAGLALELNAAAGPGRYHALDRVRALAMLLGVVYHAMVLRIFTEGVFPGAMGRLAPSKLLVDWLHSFRMPLFFLIAGFFARMMLGKYGTREFLRRRYWRIGLPLLIGMFTFGPIYVLTRELVSRLPSFGPGGPRFRPPGGKMPSWPPVGDLAGRIFGPYERFIQLNHLWFLWYLLVFVTVAPVLAKGMALVARALRVGGGDRLGLGLRLVRLGLAPVLLAAVATPALLITRPRRGWFLGLAGGIFRAFPDFLFHYDVDMLFYFAYFLVGWWLHREQDALPSVARAWPPNLVVGLAAFGAAFGLEGKYGGGPSSTTDPGIYRPVAFAAYCLGSACTSFAIIGVFLRHLNSSSRTWRYLADTALWVYLVHQPLVLLGLAACRPFHMPWWAQTAAVSAAAVASSLLLYEVMVRRTPLARVFGPSTAREARGPGVMDRRAEPALS